MDDKAKLVGRGRCGRAVPLAGRRAGAKPGRVLQGQERRPLYRLQRRRRLRRLCAHRGPPHRQAHPRQPDDRAEEHGGRRQPAPRQLALQRRAEGRVGLRHHRARHGLQSHPRYSGRPVRRPEIHLDRQRQRRGQRLRHVAYLRGDQVRRADGQGDRGRRHRRQRRHGAVPARPERRARHQDEDRQRLSRAATTPCSPWSAARCMAAAAGRGRA